MPWVKFSAPFDFDPPAFGGRVTIAYRAGQVANVTRTCALRAKAAGKAETARSPRGKVLDDRGR